MVKRLRVPKGGQSYQDEVAEHDHVVPMVVVVASGAWVEHPHEAFVRAKDLRRGQQDAFIQADLHIILETTLASDIAVGTN
ncbi:hypothetical protein L596_027743 [Steinernema carpocapsae]|uniref:Uncharacterized protein n=1 Tax=Steinernema carpocapsae TaxID=34508 RepID=A0A4U5LWD4_STECR|nr:hypothetical protein L596_027743 [Steinernema carpocapsae]